MLNEGPRRHLFIAGTGRAGTSFLVRYLDALGLETHISKSGDAQWHSAANAGLEDLPGVSPSEHLPYVVKTPWISEFIDQLIADPTIIIDALVIPVRDLRDAASSRIILELRNIYENVDGMTSYEETWRHWGGAAGGSVFSLDPVDQERILAVGFARLVQSLVRADIPLVFLDFPRIIEDADYLFDKLQPHLPATADREAAREKHRGVAEPDKVRVGQERSVLQPSGRPDASAPNAEPDRRAAFDQLDLIALRREIARHKKELKDLAGAHRQIAALEGQCSVSAQRIADLESQNAELTQKSLEIAGERAAEALTATETEGRKHTTLVQHVAELGGRNALLAQRVAELESQNAALARSTAELAGQNATVAQRATELESQNAALTRSAAELAGQNAALAQRAAELESQNAALARSTAELAGQSAALAQRAAELESRNAALARSGAELEGQTAALTQRAAELESQNATLVHSVVELKRHNWEMLRSGSWRMTRPFRSIAKRVKWIAGK